MNIDCVILAAGLSSRMGTNKMTLKLDGKTVIEQCINAFYKSCTKIIVVTGKYHDDIKKYTDSYSKVHLVYNKNYRQGMFSSVKTGVKCVDSERFFITPGDYPLLMHATINTMINTAGHIVYPVFQGKRGHPVLLHRDIIPIIINSTLDSLRDCLDSVSSVKQEICVDDKGIVTDIDTIESYERIIERV